MPVNPWKEWPIYFMKKTIKSILNEREIELTKLLILKAEGILSKLSAGIRRRNWSPRKLKTV